MRFILDPFKLSLTKRLKAFSVRITQIFTMLSKTTKPMHAATTKIKSNSKSSLELVHYVVRLTFQQAKKSPFS